MNDEKTNNEHERDGDGQGPSSPPAADTTESAAELETLRQENEELRTAARLRDARDGVIAELAGAGARSPELLFSAVIGDLEFNDAGQPVNAAALIGHLKRSYPEQFGGGRAAPSIDAGAGSSRTPDQLTPETLARMKPAEIANLDWAEVRRVLAAG
jgi:hypothetical protein